MSAPGVKCVYGGEVKERLGGSGRRGMESSRVGRGRGLTRFRSAKSCVALSFHRATVWQWTEWWTLAVVSAPCLLVPLHFLVCISLSLIPYFFLSFSYFFSSYLLLYFPLYLSPISPSVSFSYFPFSFFLLFFLLLLCAISPSPSFSYFSFFLFSYFSFFPFPYFSFFPLSYFSFSLFLLSLLLLLSPISPSFLSPISPLSFSYFPFSFSYFSFSFHTWVFRDCTLSDSQYF